MKLDILIEAVLFYKSVPQNKKRLATFFKVTEDDLVQAIFTLKERLGQGAVRLIETETEIQLSTAPELAEFIESIRKHDLVGDIGKAGAETLAIILYREPISRAEIDRIRGVNSAFIIRNLMTRGLISRESVTGNGYRFRITAALLQHLGITDKRNLPQYSDFMNTLDNFDNTTP